MIQAKEAVNIAKTEAAGLLSSDRFQLEEIEKTTYQERDCWSITLSLPRRAPYNPFAPVTRGIGAVDPDIEYKRFFVDAETGQLLGMTIREFAMR